MKIKQLLKYRWPNKTELSHENGQFYSLRDALSELDGILLRGNRMIIELSVIILQKLHARYHNLVAWYF